MGTEVEIPSGIILIALIEMSIYPECDSEWLSREYLNSSHEKECSAGRVSSVKETDSFDEAINALYGPSGCECNTGPLDPDQMHQSHFQ